MIQCVGSREENAQYCSRVCCQDAIKNAIAIKERNPAAEVVILYRDIRTYGLREDYYKKARDLGVFFVRYEVDRKPAVEQAGSKVQVKAWDYMLNRELQFDADWLVLSVGLRPHPTTDAVGAMYKVTRNPDGYYLEAHVKLRPVDFPSEGLFVAGLGHAPKNLDETIAQALAAAGRAGVILSHEKLAVSGIIAKHKRELCMSCLSLLPGLPLRFALYRRGRQGLAQRDQVHGLRHLRRHLPGKGVPGEQFPGRPDPGHDRCGGGVRGRRHRVVVLKRIAIKTQWG